MYHKRLLFVIFFVCYFVQFPALVAGADVSWLNNVSDCQSFSDGVVKFYKELGDLKSISVEQQDELEQVIDKACSEQFARCGFEICSKNRKTQIGTNNSSDKIVDTSSSNDLPNNNLPDLPLNWGNSVTSVSQSSLSASSKRIIEEDPFAKWTKEMTCDEFKGQFRALYGPLLGPGGANFEDLPIETQQEIEQVKKIACSQQYAKCAFRYCGIEPMELPPETYERELKSRMEAEKKLAEQFAEFKAKRKEAITKRAELEAREGILWKRMSVKQELVGDE